MGGGYNSAFIPDRGTEQKGKNKWPGWTLYRGRGPNKEIQ